MKRLANVSLVPAGTLGGMQGFVRWMSTVAMEAGFEVEELAPQKSSWQSDEVLWAAFGELWQNIKATHLSIKKRKDFDLFIVNSPAGYCSAPGLTIFHVNILAYAQAAYALWNPNRWKLLTINLGYDKLSSWGPRINVAVSHHQAACLKKSGIRVDEVIYNCVDTCVFQPSVDRDLLRTELGIPIEKFVVLSIGRKDRSKDWNRVLKLAHQFSSFQFLIVGPCREDFEALPANCLVVGSIDHQAIGKFYQIADIFFLPSKVECNSIALLEAMATGLPCIVTPTGMAADFIHDKNSKLRVLITQSSMDDGRLVDQLFQSPLLRSEIGTTGRDFVMRNASDQVIRVRYQELLRSLS